ncbi:hypothetical protein Pla123a_00920 [Posidoniimonas polymericola]|uniref:Uncharacterized protein n=1 Tax=Posidoniimonas polymericola TaxID=2528002 RepID=A0A5C5ZDP7_9BACT|nr:hypothetical protein [Posidoniimonas polymericola]TWT85285.1 hypothetical protein Pla123a_00920 [Posidoniimonas polymericola]
MQLTPHPQHTAQTGQTARYVLLAADTPIGPACNAANGGESYSAVYGFSDRSAYEKFCSTSPDPLRPYPLVGGLLKNHPTGTDGSVRLVVLDAPGVQADCLHAATVDEVSTAQLKRSPQVRATYVLDRNDATGVYTPGPSPE